MDKINIDFSRNEFNNKRYMNIFDQFLSAEKDPKETELGSSILTNQPEHTLDILKAICMMNKRIDLSGTKIDEELNEEETEEVKEKKAHFKKTREFLEKI